MERAVAAKDEKTRRLAAAIASNTYRANPERRSARRSISNLPDAVRAQYENEVDPTGTLTSEVRHKRAAAAWRRDEAQRQLDEHRASLMEQGYDEDDYRGLMS